MLAPSIFVSHGAPSLRLEPSPTRTFLEEFGAGMERVRAVVCATAHWESARPLVSLAPRPSMIYDFSGFPEELNHVRYAAPGDPALGRRIIELLRNAVIEASGDASRGFDHGVWSPLGLMFPDATVPVVSISVQPHSDAAHHLQIGRALRPLCAEGVLVLGSGSTTHNLREAGRKTPAHAVAFETWVCNAVADGRTEELEHWEQLAPEAKRNHPSPEHFLPLFVALGAAPDGAKGRVLNRHFEYGALSMAAFVWD
jgi:4,5-DOPA dioxygenase extradiol